MALLSLTRDGIKIYAARAYESGQMGAPKYPPGICLGCYTQDGLARASFLPPRVSYTKHFRVKAYSSDVADQRYLAKR